MGQDPREARSALGEAIREHGRDISERWLGVVTAELVDRPDVSLTQLRDGIPDYLKDLARVLCEHEDPPRASGWPKVARDHGITRVRAGFDIDQLIREFIALRHAIRDVAAEHGVEITLTDGLLADLIEATIAESVRAYIEARDHAARRTQAETIGFMIHELRNPLSIAVSAESAMRGAGLPPESQRMLDALERSHRRLIELVDTVLETERLEAGAVLPRFAETRLRELVDAACAAALRVATVKRLRFAIEYDFDGPVRIDSEMTRSAIQNVVDNAVKYTDHGAVTVVVADEGATWSVHVHDTGPGLSDEELRMIFEPFRRGSTSKPGSGLGLSIARRAVEAQQGSIHAESPGPDGCHFWITLPKGG